MNDIHNRFTRLLNKTTSIIAQKVISLFNSSGVIGPCSSMILTLLNSLFCITQPVYLFLHQDIHLGLTIFKNTITATKTIASVNNKKHFGVNIILHVNFNSLWEQIGLNTYHTYKKGDIFYYHFLLHTIECLFITQRLTFA